MKAYTCSADRNTQTQSDFCTVLFTEHEVQEETLQVKLHVKQEQRGDAGIALPTLNPGAKMWWMVTITSRPLYSRERDEAPIAQDAGWTSELVLIRYDISYDMIYDMIYRVIH